MNNKHTNIAPSGKVALNDVISLALSFCIEEKIVIMARPTPKRNRSKKSTRKWSRSVTETSDALDLKKGVFTYDDPAKIARSLKRSAMKSRRKKGTPYQSAMSMLNFYINRAGHNLPEKQKEVLEQAKEELRKVFGKAQ